MTATVDFLMAGDDEACLAAAAAAAKSGARTALLRPPKRGPRIASTTHCAVPNFVWRRFDLHEYGLSLEPASARVTLTASGEAVSTFARSRATEETLAQAAVADHLLWTAFSDDMAGLSANPLLNGGLVGARSSGAALAALFGDARTRSAFGQLAGSCGALLDDYFSDAKLKTHVAAHALSRAGLGGGEDGSAMALPELFADDAWPVRIADGGPPLYETLEQVCRNCGVSMREGKVLAVSVEDAKHRMVSITGDEKIKTRYLFFATPEAAAAAGARCAHSPLGVGGAATAVMRLTLKDRTVPAAGDEKAVFQIADDLAELQTARDEAADGRLPEQPPVEFEFTDKGDIIARTAYCPAVFREEDGLRGWTGQDRQAIAARMKARLASRLEGLSEKVVKTEVAILGAGDPEHAARLADDENIIVQPNRAGAIGAAVKLVDKVVRNG